MGMTSTLENQNIEVKDEEALMAIKKLNLYPFYSEAIDADTGELDFISWDDCKIMGYLSPDSDLVKFLKHIAKYVEGYVEFRYEEGFLYRFVFENDDVVLQQEPVFEGWDKIEKETIGA